MNIKKIVLTGGPCAGKTTGMSYIQNFFTEQGYTVIFVSEVATEIMTAGISRKTVGEDDFEDCIFDHQLAKEASYDEMIKRISNDKVLVVYDRGLFDGRAFCSEEIFQNNLKRYGLSETEAREKYGAVFHMVTAAKGAEAFYTLENNAARTETPEQAIAVDEKLVNCWNGHPHLRVIDNSSDFEGKMHKLLSEISSYLNEKGPYSTERKYLIRKPDIAYLESLENIRKLEIEQAYLNSDINETIRIRKKGSEDGFIYTLTNKRFNGKTQRLTSEKRLEKDAYEALMTTRDKSRSIINKTRYCLAANEQNFDIDIFPFMENEAILEIKLSSKETEVKIPDFIEVIKEVTDDEEYQNYSLAKNK